ncbi:ESPR domain-containing protein, partial [Burkholderia sp. MSh2]
MNKVYNVVWNRARGKLVVASELTRAGGKGGAKPVTICALAIAVAAAALPAHAQYYSVNDSGTQQGNYNNDGATGGSALAAGIG